MRLAPLAVFGALAASLPAGAQDIDARTMGLIFDAATGAKPAGSSADQATLDAALAALKAEGLVTPQRVNTNEPDVVEAYGKALLLGPRARQFLPELGEVRNNAMRRDRPATAAAIQRVFTKAGRPAPDTAQMETLLNAVIGAGSEEGPVETARRRVEKPERTIVVTDAKNAGLVTVDVTTTPPGGAPSRTVIVAERTMRPNAAGTGFDQRAVPVRVCTVTPAQATARRAALNGTWSGRDGARWDVAGSGDNITLTETRTGMPPLRYTGTYKLGRIEATHPVAAPNEIGADLPDWVRAGLVGKTAFVVRFDDCGDSKLDGTWESRHVTYDPSFQTIKRIHDPYDVPMYLSRAVTGRGVAGLP